MEKLTISKMTKQFSIFLLFYTIFFAPSSSLHVTRRIRTITVTTTSSTDVRQKNFIKEAYRTNEVSSRYRTTGSYGGRFGGIGGAHGGIDLSYENLFNDNAHQKNIIQETYRSDEINGRHGNTGSHGGRYTDIGRTHDDTELNYGSIFGSAPRQKSQTKQSYRSYEINQRRENIGGYAKRYGSTEEGHDSAEFNFVGDRDGHYKLNKPYTVDLIFGISGVPMVNGAYKGREDNRGKEGGRGSIEFNSVGIGNGKNHKPDKKSTVDPTYGISGVSKVNGAYKRRQDNGDTEEGYGSTEFNSVGDRDGNYKLNKKYTVDLIFGSSGVPLVNGAYKGHENNGGTKGDHASTEFNPAGNGDGKDYKLNKKSTINVIYGISEIPKVDRAYYKDHKVNGGTEGSHDSTEFNSVGNGDGNYKLNKPYTVDLIFGSSGAPKANGVYKSRENNGGIKGSHDSAEFNSVDKGNGKNYKLHEKYTVDHKYGSSGVQKVDGAYYKDHEVNGGTKGGHDSAEFNSVGNANGKNYKVTMNFIYGSIGVQKVNVGYKYHEDSHVYEDYERRKGSMDDGCDVDSGRHLKFGETYRKGNFIVKCEKIGTNIATTPIKCILDGTEMHIGERKRKGGFAYACQKTMTGIAMSIVGCFGDNGAFVDFGQKFTVSNFIFVCTKDGNGGFHKAYGCIIEGRKVKMGETVELGAYVYKCLPSGDGGIRTEISGCLDKSRKQIKFGQRYRDGPFLYQCRKTETGVASVLAGCIAKVSGFDQEFKFGESWNTDTSSPLSYKMKCTGNESTASTEITHCVANLDYAKSVITVGNSVQLPNTMMVFTCRRQRDGTVTGRVMSCDEFRKIEPGFSCGKTRF
ncbi:hypothetical protein TTRE_0000018501 [Trichuris trichiura]|uniref:Abnormal cell migration protein 18-like fibronectin type I domain-containing protein n=1 Tax=Trichuris trichiura TaxID=36087 RepID=A0A077YVV7_TRITR|nr:hypothetical protein TTRE_0000018501 [Trichuris trichiura]